MTALPHKTFTPEEYLAFERDSEIKHEYLDGEIYAMSGASEAHIVIAGNIGASLHAQVRGGQCRSYGSDMRVRVRRRAFFYPDLTIVCGTPLFDAETKAATLLNPTCVIEILSPSTEIFDRSEKFLRYQNLESLQEIVFVGQVAPLIERYTRQQSGEWLYANAQGTTATITLSSIGCTLFLADVYESITFDPIPDDDETDDLQV